MKIWNNRSVGSVSTNVYAKFRSAAMRIKKAIGIFVPLEKWFQEKEKEEQLEWLFGTCLPGPKMDHRDASCWANESVQVSMDNKEEEHRRIAGGA